MRLTRTLTRAAVLTVAIVSWSAHEGHAQGPAARAVVEAAAKALGRRVAIMADLPGPKMRLGKIEPEPIHLHPGDSFTLTTEDIVGDAKRVSMSFQTSEEFVEYLVESDA